MPKIALSFMLLALCVGSSFSHAGGESRPSRTPVKGCSWQHLSDAKVGLAAWVQQCDFDSRKITFSLRGGGLTMHYSDGGDDETLVEVHALEADESLEAGMRRLWAVGVSPAELKHCKLAPYRESVPPAGVKRYTFLPDAVYAKQLKASADPGDVPEPPCGERGFAPDGVQYFETHANSAVRAFLFVQAGQDEPLFDEQSLQLLSADTPGTR
ncbi:MAG: hypothetical protein ABI843_13455 [Dokdonella sp.]